LEENEQEELFDSEEIEELEESVDSEEVEPKVDVSNDTKRISFADRLPKLKEYRNKKLIRQLILITSLFIVPILATLYYISPLNKLSEVLVEGNQKVDSGFIFETSGLQVDEQIWPQYFNRDIAIQHIKEQSPRVKTVSIRVTRLNKLEITIAEHEEVALLVRGNQYLPILDNGKIIDEPQSNGDQEKVIMESFTSEKKILETLEAYNQLSSEIQKGISQVKFAGTETNNQLLNLFMNDGNQVIVNISNLASQMQYYPQVAKELNEKGVVDMEVGIFTYPYSSVDSSTENTENEEEEAQ
jgi:cell division protein FtsQ